MVASPQPRDPWEEIGRLWAAIANLSGKDLSSAVIGSGGITVTSGGSINMQGGNFTLADPSGDPLVQNDTATGWGLNEPNIPVAFSPVTSDVATQNANRDNNFYTLWFGRMQIQHPKVAFGGDLVLSTSGTASWRVKWWTSPPLTPGTGTVMGSGGPFSGSVLVSSDYTWPSNMYRQYVYLGFDCSLSASALAGDWVSITPTYAYGHGG